MIVARHKIMVIMVRHEKSPYYRGYGARRIIPRGTSARKGIPRLRAPAPQQRSEYVPYRPDIRQERLSEFRDGLRRSLRQFQSFAHDYEDTTRRDLQSRLTKSCWRE